MLSTVPKKKQGQVVKTNAKQLPQLERVASGGRDNVAISSRMQSSSRCVVYVYLCLVYTYKWLASAAEIATRER